MTKEQFINLIKTPSTINLNLIADLEEITTRFPYFQNAHLLLVKQYHGHENIRYENYLRKASAYASNREKLFRLIKDRPLEVIHITEVRQGFDLSQEAPGIEKNNFKVEEVRSVTEEVSNKNEETYTDSRKNANAIEEHSDMEIEKDMLPSIDPISIIETRLQEIHSGSNRENNSKSESENETENIHLTEKLSISNEHRENSDVEAPPQSNTPDNSEVQDEPQSNEFVKKSDQIEESTSADIQQLSTPIIELNNTTEDIDQINIKSKSIASDTKTGKLSEEIQKEKHTFSEWLKIKSLPVIPTEQIHEYLLADNVPSQDSKNKSSPNPNNLIEEFIEKEPRIVPAKSDFYSPGNMARKSAQENSDLVSETLARIYAQQGNIAKAIVTYKKLLLKKPEKSGYFAALIKELEEKDQEG